MHVEEATSGPLTGEAVHLGRGRRIGANGEKRPGMSHDFGPLPVSRFDVGAGALRAEKVLESRQEEPKDECSDQDIGNRKGHKTRFLAEDRRRAHEI